MRLKIKISPCPNDTFMFDAMLNGRIDCQGLEFDVGFDDIENLNFGVLTGDVDVSKISYAVFPQVADRYAVLDSGSALGRGNGPLLVSIGALDMGRSDLRVAVPGVHTTANRLMERFFPAIKSKTPILFSDIAPAVARGDFDCGVLIHEGRFTYGHYGLRLIADLGALWEASSGMALPLGAIVVSRSLPTDIISRLGQVIRGSVEYAMRHPKASERFVASYAAEVSRSVIESHISLFVNDFSLSLGDKGRSAVSQFLSMSDDNIFANACYGASE